MVSIESMDSITYENGWKDPRVTEVQVKEVLPLIFVQA